MLVALILGTSLALAALGYVLYPVFSGVPGEEMSPSLPRETASDPVQVLREIEFDRVTGKLSDEDYAALRAQYTRAAIEQMRASDQPAPADVQTPAPAADFIASEAERLIARMRNSMACPDCGPRPEPDATWCSSCGSYLPHECARCGGEIRERGARFCSRCGELLAA